MSASSNMESFEVMPPPRSRGSSNVSTGSNKEARQIFNESFDFLSESRQNNNNTNLNNNNNKPGFSNSSASSSSARTKISAETLRVLSSANLNNLDFNTRFELIFNDLAMLKSSAVQGILGKNYLRALAWMVFLDCLPFDKSTWTESISTSRREFESVREQVFRDPRSSLVLEDHPFSSEAKSSWNNYFERIQLRELITQDVVRM